MRRLLCLLVLAAPATAHAQAPALVPGPSTFDGTALVQEVRNVGDAEAPGGAGTLAGQSRDYPAIAPGAAASNATPFAVSAPAGAACGDPVDLRLALGGFEMPLRLAAGAGGTRVYANGAAVDLPASGSGTSAVTVGPVGKVWDANVRIDLVRHEFAADLTLELVAPDGTVVKLAQRRGGNGQDFDRTLFDDQALAPVADADAPFNAQLRPDEPLAALRGLTAQGEWRLRVIDHAAGDAGAIEGWSLELIADDCDASTPDPEPGGTGTQAGAGAGSGAGGGTGSGAGSPAGRLRPPTLSLRGAPKSARRFARRGVLARVGCPDPCRFRVELFRGRKRLARTGFRVLPSGEFTTVRLRHRGKRLRRGTLLTVRLTTGDGRAVERRFRLRRR